MARRGPQNLRLAEIHRPGVSGEVRRKNHHSGAQAEEIETYGRSEMTDTPRTTLADGTQVYPSHKEINPKTGMQRDYVVLASEEREKSFIRPVRQTYRHLTCGAETTMSRSIAETYARNPAFYHGTFCTHCRAHFPVGADGQFVWSGSDERVGT
jgi:hypothetical protein